MPTWLIYGAYGYTGKLVAEEAISRGHTPILAGRDGGKLRVVADALKLPSVAVTLDDADALEQALGGVDLVFHAAGPFAHTSAPMVDACLRRGVHYVDVTGEISVFASIFARDAEAKQKGVALLPGAGFDVVPTDCLAAYVVSKLPGATDLEIAFTGMHGISAGTARSNFEGFLNGGFVRRDGRLTPTSFGTGVRHVRFDHGVREVMALPWGDLETAYRSTGVPNITTYMAFPRATLAGAKWLAPVLPAVRGLLSPAPIQRAIKASLAKVQGPDESARKRGASHVWACARDGSGREVEAWLRTAEGYRFTALAGVRVVERVLAQRPVGALTPSLAFGADFVLSVEGTDRFDSLPWEAHR